MNIANIFGLHIGCKVKCKGQKKTGFVIRVLPDYEDTRKWEIGVQFWNEKKTWNTIHDISITECKLILKPLSAITDEDKAELAKFIENSYHKKGEVVISNVYWCSDLQGLKYTRNGSKMQIYDDSPEIMFKLATMGYDIGLVPDEYKEVEE